jgi:serine/threonine protein kinase
MTARDLADSTLIAGEPPAPSSRGGRATIAGRYRSLFVVGRGGMGTVEAALELWPPGSARDLAKASTEAERGYQRVVALKRLLPDSAHDKRRVDMFLREARLAAMLDHPNIVRAFDYGEAEGGLFLAMEYVEGQPLSKVLKTLAEANERLPADVVAWMLAEVCRGLHAAHELTEPTSGAALRLVHRDVSPQNVMLGYDGRVRLLDFGVAKIEAESVTKTGEVKGKTAYMSPEQAMGDTLDRRSDLFGVGAVLFECLALRRMWGDGTDMEVIRKLALESPPALETAGAALPDGLSELHARLVARDAKGRPESANEVAKELARFVADPDAAARSLRTILQAHFAAKARDEQARLTRALHEVAPEQADELRESMLPTVGAMTPIRKRPPPSESPPPKQRRSPLLPLGGLVLAIGAIFAWRSVSGAHPTTISETPPLPPPIASSAVVTTTIVDTATPPATASAVPSATASAPAVRPSSTSRPAVTSRPTASPRASSSSVKPPDLDEKPF